MASPNAPRAFLRWFSVAAGIFVVLLLIFFVFDRIALPLYTRQGTEKAIPDLVGLSVEDAARRADSANFVLIMGVPKPGGDVSEGTVLEQRPFAGSLAKPGRKIHVIPALAAQRDLAPDLVGLDVRDAQVRCRNANLLCTDADLSYRFSSTIPKNVVIAQRPLAGEVVESSAVVKLIVSLGTEPDHFFVPYLMERPLHEARVILRESGLRLGRIVRKETDHYPTGTVIAQSVKSGQEVTPETAVDIVVAVPSRTTSASDEPADSAAGKDAHAPNEAGDSP
ncbi:MAG: PASTA domain-containing protein [bacterium]|nr:PASTA domain-containing protein [bacterium]